MNPFADCDCVRSIRGAYKCFNCRMKELKFQAEKEEREEKKKKEEQNETN